MFVPVARCTPGADREERKAVARTEPSACVANQLKASWLDGAPAFAAAAPAVDFARGAALQPAANADQLIEVGARAVRPDALGFDNELQAIAGDSPLALAGRVRHDLDGQDGG